MSLRLLASVGLLPRAACGSTTTVSGSGNATDTNVNVCKLLFRERLRVSN